MSKKAGLSIGTKFLMLILSTLLIAVTVIVFNATRLFQKDNLNNIYVASDLLTAAKAGETRAWVNGLIQKGTVIGKILLSKSDSNILETLTNDTDVLEVALFKKESPTSKDFKSVKTWSNPNLLRTLKLTPENITQLRHATKISYDKLGVGVIQVSSQMLSEEMPGLVLNVPLVKEKSGQFSAFFSLIARQDKLTESFSDGGAYTLALVDGEGKLLAHPEMSRVKNQESVANLPIVAKMLESTLEREFKEFTFNKIRFLGAYAKVGIAGMGVISQVPRSRAFEAGQTLIRRSILIAVLVLSIAFVVAYIFAQTLISPIRKLSEATKQIALGNFKIRVEVNTRDEIASLAASFNTMSSEIARKIQNLSTINESAKVISSTLEAQKLMEFSLETLINLIHAQKGIAWLWNAANSTVGLTFNKAWADQKLDVDHPLVKASLKCTQPTIADISGKSCLVIPIQKKTGIMGFVVLSDRMDGKVAKKFTEEDIFMAGTIITSVGITFENIELLKKTAENARMEKELETAKLVQDTMFPPRDIHLAGFEVQSYYVPAGECGGDWWGMLELPEGKVLLAIGDATGHGVPAALVTATAKAACSVIHRISQEVPQIASSPSQVLHFLNKAVYESTLGKILMTFFVAVLDTKTGEVTYATASHDPVYWYKMPEGATPENGSKDNVEVLLSEPGPRLGQNAVSNYQTGKIQLKPKDLIILYTDGLTEGKSPDGGEWGDRKFLRSIGKFAHQDPTTIRENLLEEFHKFILTEPLHDDVTLVVCKFDPALKAAPSAPKESKPITH
jgi:serine phosphatase RsbU (regulator of sigma subunit)/HAMP domain-containing protein